MPARALAIPRYEELSEKRVLSALDALSATELAAIEEHERGHQARPAVLEKLHYLALGGVDAATAKAIQVYERKGRESPASRNHRTALQQEARYHRERLDLYRAKLYGGRPVSEAKLRELERAADGASARLRRAGEADEPGARSG